jgi:hypothetical protein
MKNTAEARISHPEDSLGPYRPIRTGEIVTLNDVTNASGKPMVPERIYGGRRARLSVLVDRRQPPSTTRKP